MKFNELGRSMVEMLGILAIIGVLSVGAISGYSKAMMKYKLNKQAEQISSLINMIYTYQYQISAEPNDSLIPIYQKLNAIPDGMSVQNEYLKDAFGTYSTIYIYNHPLNHDTVLAIYGKPQYETPITFPSIDIGISYCRNILLALQPIYRENPKGFTFIYLRNQPGGGKNINLVNAQYDFANMSISEINNICEQQFELTDKKQVYFQFYFKNTK